MFVRRRCCCVAPFVVPACCCGCHAVPCVALSTLACRHALRVAGRGARLVVPHRRALVLVRLRTAGCRVLRRLRLRRCRPRVRAVRVCRCNSMPGYCYCYGSPSYLWHASPRAPRRVCVPPPPPVAAPLFVAALWVLPPLCAPRPCGAGCVWRPLCACPVCAPGCVPSCVSWCAWHLATPLHVAFHAAVPTAVCTQGLCRGQPHRT